MCHCGVEEGAAESLQRREHGVGARSSALLAYGIRLLRLGERENLDGRRVPERRARGKWQGRLRRRKQGWNRRARAELAGGQRNDRPLGKQVQILGAGEAQQPDEPVRLGEPCSVAAAERGHSLLAFPVAREQRREMACKHSR